MLRHLTRMVLLLLSLQSFSVFAVGLGQIQVFSAHNQPLKAEIQLLSAANYNENEFQVKLASNEEYEKHGIEKSHHLGEISFKTVRDKNGKKVIKITTNQSVKEPHINILVELIWPRGQLVKEYTFLLEASAIKK